jgi:hypothetical protein
MEEVAEQFLPDVEEPEDGKAKAADETAAESQKPAGAEPAGPKAAVKKGDGSAPSAKKCAPAPECRSILYQRNAWSGATEGVTLQEGSIVIYEDNPRTLLGTASPGYRIYGQAEYLLWWTKGYHLPPLITTAPATVPEDVRGTLGVDGTAVLFGDSNTGTGPRSGGRFTAGWFLDPCGTCAVEGGYFFLGRKNNNFLIDSSQFPVLARPFFNVNIGAPDRELTASPGTSPGDFFKLRGSIAVNNFTDLEGAELDVRRCLCSGCDWRVGVLAGFRYLHLHEGLGIAETVTSAKAVPGFPIFDPGNQIVVSDNFRTRNRFYGGQLGVDGEIGRGRWSVTGRFQLGLGVTHESVDIAGSQVVTTLAGQRTVFNGGLLALPSNSGLSSQNRFSVVPQVGVKLGYNFTDNLRLFVGYDFLYWTNVIRPGDQVDLALNVTQIPNFGNNPAFAPPSNIVRPIVPFHTTDFWAQGINVGFELRY